MLQTSISTDSQVETGPPLSEHSSETKADSDWVEGNNNPPLLLITANVGSLFEDPHRLLQPWLKEFLQKVEQLQPQFLALHLQEVGGKTYDKSMEYVQEFIRALCEASEMKDFSFIRIYMDEDFNSAEHFTALGNLYFGHKNLENLRIWNFLTHGWEQALGRNIYSGSIETIATKEKSKFPQHFFPECKWSRKGFMRTRWEINGTVIDLVNIHLFHDASNLAASEEFPSVYCKTRRRALVHTLERFHLDDKNGLAPYFVFGDFNFRCDTEGVIKELTQNLSAHRVQSIKSDSTKVHYRNAVGDNVLTVGKKEFNHADHQLKFKETWLKKYDRELEVLSEILVEFAIKFPPSYPYEEDPDMPADYMSTRCPSWCDRILMSPEARKIITVDGISNPYNVIGESVCMGDHKPIYLHVRIKSNQGTYRCCNCYRYANNNKSTSRHHPAVTIACTTSTPSSYCCPHQSRAYNEILFDCERLNTKNICPTVSRAFDELAVSTSPCLDGGVSVAESGAFQLLQSSQIADETCDAGLTKCPPVSINVINSENMHVCRCSQIASTDTNIDGEGNVNSLSICPECSNIIKRQPSEHRYRLVSKQLLLANNIIVNRIDTQYLNALFDVTKHRQDPYTPESVESHSPCPELNSTSTTSSNSRSPYERVAVGVTSGIVDAKTHPGASETRSLFDGAALEPKQQQRGVVTPGQLKSRLEDLKRYSLNSSGAENGTAGDSDVEDVDDICQTSTVHKTHTSSCLPGCCHWKQIDQVPERLQQIANEILGDQADVWKEQSLVESRTRYIQISQICRTEPQQSEADFQDMNGVAGQSCVSGDYDTLSSASLDHRADPVAILKETTV